MIPTPKKVETEDGYRSLPLTIYADAEFSTAAKTFRTTAAKLFSKDITDSTGGIVLRYDSSLPATGYTLDTRDKVSVILSASTTEGIFYAIATLLQIITETCDGLMVAKAFIQDTPDKDYRALMVDLAREWHPLSTLLKYIDLCFMLKIRYLHLHFIDDQRYTLPSRAFPEITKNRQYYTEKDIVTLRTYARDRGILLVPEFEAPGHAALLVKTYPEVFALHYKNDDDTTIVTESGAIISAENIICAGSQKANDAIKTLLTEIGELFPESPFIHIGGDEANIRAWNCCTECVQYMKEHNISDVYELYSEFVGRVAQMVLDLGKTPIVWEGFPEKGVQYIPKETIVIAWESYYQLAPNLLKNGFRIINASWQPLYIVPHHNIRWGVKEILNWNVYNWQHWWSQSVATLNPIHVAPTDQVLGAQICAWESTYELEIGKVLESLPTLAERTWNVHRLYTEDVFIDHLDVVLQRIAHLIQDV